MKIVKIYCYSNDLSTWHTLETFNDGKKGKVFKSYDIFKPNTTRSLINKRFNTASASKEEAIERYTYLYGKDAA